MSYVGLELTGMNVLDVVKDSKKQARCIQALAEHFPASAGFVTIMDLSVEAEAFGAQVKYEENETPTVIGQLIGNVEAAVSLKVPEIGSWTHFRISGSSGTCFPKYYRQAALWLCHWSVFSGGKTMRHEPDIYEAY